MPVGLYFFVFARLFCTGGTSSSGNCRCPPRGSAHGWARWAAGRATV